MLPYDILSIIISYLDKDDYCSMAKYLESEGIDIYTICPSPHFIIANYACSNNLHCIVTLWGNYFIDIAIGQTHVSCMPEYRDGNYIVTRSNGEYVYEMEQFRTHSHGTLNSVPWRGSISPYEMHEVHIRPSLVECKDGGIVLIIKDKTYKINKGDYVLVESEYLLFGDCILYPHLNAYSHIPIIRKLGFNPMDIKKIKFSTFRTHQYIVVIFNSDPDMIHVFFPDTNTHICEHKNKLSFGEIRTKDDKIYLYDIMRESKSMNTNKEKFYTFNVTRYKKDTWGKTIPDQKRSREFTIDLETDLYNVSKIIKS